MLAGAAAWSDWTRREVPNPLIAALGGMWIVAALWAPGAVGGPPSAALVCGAAALAAGFVLFLPGWIGAGDGKLMGALGLWLGPHDLPIALLGAAGLLTALLVPVLARVPCDFRERGLPVACALAPPAIALLAARAYDAAWV